MKFSTVSNIGKVRSKNQDYFGNTRKSSENDFFIVADGMGGYKGGEIASKLASKYFIDFIENNEIEDFASIVDFQEAAIRYANQKVYDFSLTEEDYANMGTTVVCLCLDYKNRTYHVTHIGDSRAYIYTGGSLQLITRDHSLVNDLVDSGSITQSEAKNFANKNTITRAVGVSCNLKPESRSFDMHDGDIVLLVTDGLTNEVTDEEIQSIVSQNDNADEISTNLVDLAIKKGGHDNITVTTILI
ncbi:MAG: Stp1/IreP family PP2C-type Ser/Thr phosphatase [Anaerococcus sp.]|jgi:serine/threonine protein phosphatase PrpC|nr:Stp1/IreP family PP2C-type Ser/Thr phosphatase [Peptoniphilaceae bacterium]MDY3056028.1 Stp1/IreP family PP2C-type Ser/Thr phosphatase [Anaerococcus sp.]